MAGGHNYNNRISTIYIYYGKINVMKNYDEYTQVSRQNNNIFKREKNRNLKAGIVL